MKFGKISMFVAGVVACAPLAAFAQGAAGNWEVTVDGPQGPQAINVSLTENAGKLGGTMTTPLGAVDVDGTTTGADTVVNAKIDAQGMQLVLTFHGTVTGDAFNGKVQLGDFGEAPFSGKRVAAKAPMAPAAAMGGNATGKWDITISIPAAGDFPMTGTFTQAGAAVTGMMSSPATGDVPVTGTLTGNAITMKFTAQTQAGEIPVTMTGTLSGATLTGKAVVEGLGDADWTGKRAQP